MTQGKTVIHQHSADSTEIRLKRAKRSRLILILAIIIGIAILCTLAFLGYKIINDHQDAMPDIIAPTATLDKTDVSGDGQVDDTLTKTVAMANLATLIGTKSGAVMDKLGANYKVVEAEKIKDKKNPDNAQLITYTNSGNDGSAAWAATASTDTLYLTLNKKGIVVDVYDVVSMDALGYPQTPFMILQRDSNALSNVLRNIGITPIELNYATPKLKDVTTYKGKKGATNRLILKQEVSYEGKAQGTVVDTWKVTFVYNYGSGVPANGSDPKTESRTLAVRIVGKK